MPETVDVKNAGSENVNPIRSAATVTPSNTTNLDFVTRGILVGNTAGDICALFADGKDPVTFPVAANQFLPFQLKRIYSTGTTATTITALW